MKINNGVGKQGDERGDESRKQQHGDQRVSGGRFRGAEREVGDVAEGHRSPRGREDSLLKATKAMKKSMWDWKQQLIAKALRPTPPSSLSPCSKPSTVNHVHSPIKVLPEKDLEHVLQIHQD
ncbi:uncharacterized protein LOC130776659 [Actinidia eriantha]|uniref:uncharacterized protein LOC130776659 n=1 Tax=Actinidia eriantha TaxID=165200 RepID=UPI00258880C6|nr:uncharacterized protein LOC130776659 [Actinidia eriantha]